MEKASVPLSALPNSHCVGGAATGEVESGAPVGKVMHMLTFPTVQEPVHVLEILFCYNVLSIAAGPPIAGSEIESRPDSRRPAKRRR